jgi:propanediol dehydratase small subunit
MTENRLGIADYPLAETRPAEVRGARGFSLEDITLDAVIDGRVDMEDLRITPEALLQQAEIAEAAGRPTLAANFRRASELTRIPQPVIMETYELLRPGRAEGKHALLAAAARLRDDYGAERMAEFIEEAAEVYERRGLFTFRY